MTGIAVFSYYCELLKKYFMYLADISIFKLRALSSVKAKI